MNEQEQAKQFRGMFMKKSDVAPLIHGYGPFGSPATELSPSDIKDEGDFKTAGGYTIGWSDAAKERHKAEKHPITETGQVVFGFAEEMAKSRAGALKVGAKISPTPKEFAMSAEERRAKMEHAALMDRGDGVPSPFPLFP